VTDEIELDGNCRAKLEKAIAGALTSTLAAHGPITPSLVSSAAKRVIGAIKGYNKMARDTAKRKLQDSIIDSLNSSYRWYLEHKAGSPGRRHYKDRANTLIDFGRSVGALNDEETFSAFLWHSKWSIKPGPFRIGVDWSKVVHPLSTVPQNTSD